MKGAGWLLTLGFLLVAGVSAQAASGPPSRDPQTLNAEAKVLAEKDQWDKAIEKWRIVLSLVEEQHRHIVHKNIGRAYQKWGKLPHAWFHLTRANDQAPGDPMTVEWLAEVEKSLKSEGYCRLRVDTKPDGALATGTPLDGEDRAATSFLWWFQKGKYLLSFEKPGYKKATRQLDVVDCQSKTFIVDLESEASDGVLKLAGDLVGSSVLIDGGPVTVPPAGIRLPPGPHEIHVERSGSGSWNTQVIIVAGKTEEVVVPASIAPPPATDHVQRPAWPYVTFGTGLAAVVSGGITYGIAWSRLSDIDDKYSGSAASEQEKQKMIADHEAEVEDKVRPLEITSYLLWGAGGVAAVVGGYFAFRGHDSGKTAGTFQLDGIPIHVTPLLPGGLVVDVAF